MKSFLKKGASLAPWLVVPALILVGVIISFFGGRKEQIYLFPGVTGPEGVTVVPSAHPTTLTGYGAGSKSRLAVLLTNPASSWLGIAHGLKSIGVPFLITDDYKEALGHKVVLVYPEISGVVMTPDALKALAAFPRNGGTLLGVHVLGGGFNEVFGFQEAVPSRAHLELRFSTIEPLLSSFTDPSEAIVRLADLQKLREAPGTYSYTQNRQPPLATYEDGTVAITQKSYEQGRVYGFGVDLGLFLLKGFNNRAEEISRSYVNEFEPTVDVLLRLLKEMYRSGEPQAVTIGTVPFGKSLSVLMTHDVDYTRSMENAVRYAEYEKAQGITGTYFIQTKYVRDYNDEIFFNEQGVQFLKQLVDLGMELGSHTVAHSKVLSKFPLGTGAERYPSYRPFVQSEMVAYDGTILGELRVSKFLIEKFSGKPVFSFRPGELSNPSALPQALEASGYQFSSSVTANSSLTHLPFQLNYDRGAETETKIFEFPVTIEDEESPKLGDRLPQALDLAERIRRYGGCFVVLIHPDIVDHKLEFEKGLVEAVKEFAWFGSVGEFGRWWSARNELAVDVSTDGTRHTVAVDAPKRMSGVTLELPAGWKLKGVEPRSVIVEQVGRSVMIREAAGTIRMFFVESQSEVKAR